MGYLALRARAHALVARLRPRAGRVRRGLQRRYQNLLLVVRSKTSRPIAPEDLAQHYADLKTRHFGRPSQLDIGSQPVRNVCRGDAVVAECSDDERINDRDAQR
ncbi:MAG: hypothetical protein ACR2Q4_00110 [Geminicoccaceae bacterium]